MTAAPTTQQTPSPLSSTAEWIRLERTVEHVGKVKKESKRRIVWVLQHEASGALFRIILMWSVKTGKYSVTVNDREEVFDRRQGSSLIDHSFQLPPVSGSKQGTAMRMVAAKTVPRRTPFVQYDLMVNGVKFHDLPGDFSLPDEGLPSLVHVVVHNRSTTEQS